MPDPLPLPLADIEAAAARLAPHVLRTPTVPVVDPVLEQRLGTGTELLLKLELLQYTGTFKVRGAFNVALHLEADARERGVTAISAGNHAIAVAHVARALGLTARVVMLESANPFRVAQARALGAEVLPCATVAEGFERVERLVQEQGLTLIHPFEGPYTLQGTGCVGLEFVADAPDLDAVIVPIGGGGLLGGVAAAVKQRSPSTRVYGVEPVGAPTMTRALEAGEPVPIGKVTTIADSLGGPFAGPLGLALAQAHVDEVVLVEDDALREAQALGFERFKLALEPAAAASTAALLGPLAERLAGRRVGLVMCGSNIDVDTWRSQVP